jgi:MFS family permease
MAGLFLYVFGGCGAGLIDNIWIVLVFRALVGCGVGLIMPMSTGLLSFYFPPEETDRLMGLSSAMNQIGGAVATFIAGILSAISWRAAFLVYLMGLISVVLCTLLIPDSSAVHINLFALRSDQTSARGNSLSSLKRCSNCNN